MKKVLTLDIHKTYFTVRLNNKHMYEVMYNITRFLKSKKYVYNRMIKRMVVEDDKSYFSFNSKSNTYRFTIGVLKDVLATFGRNEIKREDIQIKHTINNNVRGMDLIFKDEDFTLRDYQQTYSDILVHDGRAKPILLVDLATGYGKSLIAAHALTRINEVTMILVLPKYIEKWRDDLFKYTDATPEDICYIKGGDSIRALMNMKQEDIRYRVFIASITTMNYMISDYENDKIEYPYPLPPHKFMDHLGVGVLLNDETHQHFHALLKVSLYMNVNQIIGLSATLDSNRNEMKRLYSYMFPSNHRISNIAKIERYTYVKAIEYNVSSLKGIKYTTAQGYSHIAYEQSIMCSRRFLESYFKMIAFYVERDYIKRKQDGERLLIFMSTVAMCTAFTNYLKDLYPSLDIRRYVEDDPYENVINAEISISTVISASTAIDIPKLITVINTISMASLQANLQSMGRLRKIEGRDVWYIYMYCPHIPNQKNMHKIRRDTIKEKAKLIVYDQYPITLITR